MFPKFEGEEVVVASVQGTWHGFGRAGAECSHKAQASRCLGAVLGTRAWQRADSTQDMEVVQFWLLALLWSQCSRNWSRGPAVAVWLVAMMVTAIMAGCDRAEAVTLLCV